MRIATAIRQVFGHFHNLNLLALIHDLRNDQTARQNWTTNDALLCPVAHGLANGQQVKEINLLGEFANLQRACTMSANWLGADPGDVLHFVRSWDDYTITTDVLLDHLQQIWHERLADAEAVQEVMNGPGSVQPFGLVKTLPYEECLKRDERELAQRTCPSEN